MSDSNPTPQPQTQPSTTIPKSCEACLRGGFPMKRELLSFTTLFFIGCTTVLAVFLLNEKRELLALKRQAPKTEQKSETSEKKWELPQVKTVTSAIDLPDPATTGKMSVENAIAMRRSRRTFATTPVSLQNLSQILWSAQGITDPKTGYRTAPSGMSAFPFTAYVVVRNVTGVAPGFYQYMPEKNQLGDVGIANAGELLTAAGVQAGAQQAPVVVVLAASPAKTAAKLRNPGDPMVDVLLEAGHIGQNMYLQAESLKMAMVVMGGFDAKKVGQALKLDTNEEAVYLIPVGNRATETATPAATTAGR